MSSHAADGPVSGGEVGGIPTQLSDLTGLTPALWRYVFVRTGGVSATISGYFVDLKGAQIGNSITGSITAAQTSFADLAGGSLPADAVGFIGVLSGASVYVGLSNNAANAKSGETPNANYPVVATSTYVTFGRTG